ncbi:MAG: glycosyltransferase [Rehaibacterium terrae]|uniref:glycosyltransferase n=1 Tax=Rehaibacterium terrae TaxID=1341696 RepID=UPI00391B3A9D
MNQGIRFSLDSLTVRGQRLFGWGFCLDPSGPLDACELRLRLADGREQIVPCFTSGMRDDLIQAYPDIAHAGAAGFMVQALLPSRLAQGTPAQFVGWRAGVEACRITLGDFPEAYAPPELLPLGHGGRRLLKVIRQRGVAAAARSLLRGIRDRLRFDRVAESLIHQAAGRPLVVVIDHAMGGGANRYRRELLDRLAGEGKELVLVTPRIETLSYRAESITGGERPMQAGFASQDELLAELARLDIVALHVNDLVGFDDPPKVLDWALDWRRRGAGRRLSFHVHDFHAVCPAFTLIGADGHYCGVPDLAVCRACLPANARHTLGLHTDMPLPEWRRAWSRFLAGCDEVVAFSEASVAIFERAFGPLDRQRLVLRPHRVERSHLRAVEPVLDSPLVVAAVGHLSHAKGAGVLLAMADLARRESLPVRFVVIGTLEGVRGGHSHLQVLGAYAPERLCDLLEELHAGIAFVPSICPETYSYVADELMATGLPLAVFDVGAPAERVRAYPRGRVIADAEPRAALDALLAFATDLRRDQARGSHPEPHP